MLADRACYRYFPQRIRCGSVTFLSASLLALMLMGFGSASAVQGADAKIAPCEFVLDHSTLLFASCSQRGSLLLSESSQHEQAPLDELTPVTSEAPTDVNTGSTLQVESDWTAVIYWQPASLPSPRLIPRGLVLSYLCDSARHQCCGVQLI